MTSVGPLTAGLAAAPFGTASLDELRQKPVAEVAQEFEALLVAQMIGAMRRTVGESGLLQASPERRMLDGFFDLELARSMVASTDLGLGRQLAAQLEARGQDAPLAPPAPLGDRRHVQAVDPEALWWGPRG